MKRTLALYSAVILAPLTLLPVAHAAAVASAAWGNTGDGQPVQIYTLTDSDLTIRITNYGAHIVSVDAPGREGKKADVVLGYKDLAGYLSDTSTYMGSIVGRYGNRIARGTFNLNGTVNNIPTNDHGNALHGGTDGFDKKVWTGRTIKDGVELTLVSPAGDMGFPGQLTAHVRYTLEGKSLHITYAAETTKPTVVNLTNHTYFNLGGEGSGPILNEVITIAADRYTPVNSTLIPTGQLAPVAGTPFDFLKPTPIGERIEADNEQLKIAGGYDHNFVLNGTGKGLHPAAMVVDPATGRTLTVTTTEPGVQFYSGNFLDGSKTGAAGNVYVKHAGFCLETQHFPDSPNQPSFPTTTLNPGQTLHSETVFTFGVQK